jgi:hypothetical protein
MDLAKIRIELDADEYKTLSHALEYAVGNAEHRGEFQKRDIFLRLQMTLSLQIAELGLNLKADGAHA